MKIVINISEEEYVAILGNADIIRKRKKNTLEESVLNGIPLTENEYICEKVKIINSQGEKLEALLDKARMMFWCAWISADFAKKVLGWEFTETEDTE